MRLELIHPLLVHFPIALLITGVVIRIAAIWGAKRPNFFFLLPAAWMILFLGVIAVWMTVIAGEIARDIVEPSLENVAILDKHQLHAYLTAVGFTLGLLIDLTRVYLLRKLQLGTWLVKNGLVFVVWFLYLFSLTNLIITASYGAILVYEEGAAVNRP